MDIAHVTFLHTEAAARLRRELKQHARRIDTMLDAPEHITRRLVDDVRELARHATELAELAGHLDALGVVMAS